MKAGRDEDVWRRNEVIKFLNRSRAWFQLHNNTMLVRWPDGQVIRPDFEKNGYGWYSLDTIMAMAESAHRHGLFEDDELELVRRRVDAFRNPPKRKKLTVMKDVRYGPEQQAQHP